MAAHRKRCVVDDPALWGAARRVGLGTPAARPTSRIVHPKLHVAALVAVMLAAAAIGAPGFSGIAKGQAFSRVLEDVRLFGKGESIQIVFSEPFEGIPNEDYAPGRFALTFTGVGSKKPARDLRAREEILFREIKIVQNRYSTTVTFVLRDPTLNLKGRVGYTRDKNLLNIEVRPPGAPPTATDTISRPAAEALLSELEQKIAGAPEQKPQPASSVPVHPPTAPAKPLLPAQVPAPAAPAVQTSATPPPGATAASAPPAPGKPAQGSPLALGGMPESDFFGTLATMVVALAIMLGGLYGILYLYKRYLHGRLARFAGTPAVRQIASFSIGPRQRIVILEINGDWIACGVTPSQITFLTRLAGGHAAAQGGMPQEAEAPVAGPVDGAPSPTPAKLDPVHQFAEVLKQKVRSLKRIN